MSQQSENKPSNQNRSEEIGYQSSIQDQQTNILTLSMYESSESMIEKNRLTSQEKQIDKHECLQSDASNRELQKQKLHKFNQQIHQVEFTPKEQQGQQLQIKQQIHPNINVLKDYQESIQNLYQQTNSRNVKIAYKQSQCQTQTDCEKQKLQTNINNMNNTSQKLKKQQQQITERLNKKIQELTSQNQDLKTTKRKVQKQMKKKQNDLQEKQSEIACLQQYYINLQTELNHQKMMRQKTVEQISKKLYQFQEIIGKNQSQLQKCRKQSLQKDQKIRQLQEIMSKYSIIIEEQSKKIDIQKQKCIQLQVTIANRQALIVLLEENVQENTKLRVQIQSNAQNILQSNLVFYQKLTSQFRQENSQLRLKNDEIIKEQTGLILQLLQQKEHNMLAYEKIAQLTNQLAIRSQQLQITFTQLQEKKRQIQKNHQQYALIFQKQNKLGEQMYKKNEEMSAKMIMESNQFYLNLIYKQEQDWQKSRQILQFKIDHSKLMLKEKNDNERRFEKDLNNRIKISTISNEILQRKWKEELVKSEDECMNLNSILDERNEQIEFLRLNEDALKAQNDNVKNAINLICRLNDFTELVQQLGKINVKKVFDGLIQTFISIQENINRLHQKIDEKQLKAQSLTAQNVTSRQIIEKLAKQNKQNETNLLSVYNQHQLSLKQKDIEQEQLKKLLKESQKLNIQLKQKIEGQIVSHQILLEKARLENDELNERLSKAHNENNEQKHTNQIEILKKNIEELNNKITVMTNEERKLKYANNNLSQINMKLTSQNLDIKKKIEKQIACKQNQQDVSRLNKDNESLKREIENLNRQISSLNKELTEIKNKQQVLPSAKNVEQQMIDSYEELYLTVKQEKDLIETQLTQLKQKYNKLKNAEKNSKTENQALNKAKQIEFYPNFLSSLSNFFTMPSLIENDHNGKQFVVSSIQKFCDQKIEKILMIFKMDENNKSSFHSTFKSADMNEGIYIYLFKKKSSIFGFVTFHQKIKGIPSTIMFSVNNKRCIFKNEQKYETTAFKYEFNTLYFGNNEAKFKSGFKTFSVSETVSRRYFDNYAKSQIFGEEFRQILQIQFFEIHKVFICR